jgi:phenylalanyl-tRNA synthetase beta subunit
MKFSKRWLEDFLATPLPADEQVVETLSSYAFEVEDSEKTADGDSVFDIKILPNRAGDCLSHVGMARELSALLDIPMKEGEKAQAADLDLTALSSNVAISIDEGVPCRRYVGAVMNDVKVGPSPEWLRMRLEAIGQRSINNVVDATNYVMFAYGQPMHAFDLSRLSGANIHVRMAKEGEAFVTLSNEEKTLDPRIVVIADGGNDAPLAMAGVKGGQAAGIDENTTSILLEAANFTQAAVRYAARSRQILSDSSKRFEADLSADIAFEAMRRCISLISEIAGGTVTACADSYPSKDPARVVALRASKLRSFSGLSISDAELESILIRRKLPFVKAIPRAVALSYLEGTLGAPYVWDPSVEFVCPACFDCSALCAWIYWQAGIWIPPRKSCDQLEYCEEVSQEDMQPGDLIFSNTHDGKIRYATEDWMAGTAIPKGVDHVGVYVGDGEVIHATRQYGKVVREKLAENPKKWGDIVKVGRVPGADEESYLVSVPTYRKDIRTEEDLIEEVMQQYGYNNLPVALRSENEAASLTEHQRRMAAVRSSLQAIGFNEIYGYAFRDAGVVEVENPIASDKGFLRTDLSAGMKEALTSNIQYMDLAGVPVVAFFEIGAVFPGKAEEMHVCIGAADGTKKGKGANVMMEKAKETLAQLGVSLTLPAAGAEMISEFNLEDVGGEKAKTDEGSIAPHPLVRYSPYSVFPPVSRDVAFFAPQKGIEKELALMIGEAAGPLTQTVRLFDRFEKSPTEISYGFRIVLQASDHTLTETEVTTAMERVGLALKEKGYTVR